MAITKVFGSVAQDVLSTENNLSDLENSATARTNLGVAIGSDVQAYDADLTALGNLSKTDGNFIVGNGTTWVAESGSTARTSLGLGTAATTNSTAYATAAQGTKADSALQPANNLSDLSNSDTALDNLGFSSFGKTLIDDVDAAAVRTTLGLGTAATSNALGGAQDFVATGAISAGQIVGLRSDGTVEVIEDGTTTQTENAGTPVVFRYAQTYSSSTTFDSNSNKIVIAYQDVENSKYGTAIVGTVSGTSISFGIPVVFYSSETDFISATFDSNSNKVVIAYRDFINSYKGTAVVGTIFTDYLFFEEPVIFNNRETDFISATFDSSQNKVVIAYRDFGLTSHGTAVVGTVSGTSLNFAAPKVFENAQTQFISTTFDSNLNKIVIAYRDEVNSGYGTAVVGTVSGGTISFGAPVIFEYAGISYTSAVFDSNSNKIVIAYRDEGNSNRGTAVVGTVSGTSISFGSPINPVVFSSAETIYFSAIFDSFSNKVVIIYQDYGNFGYGTAVVGTVSGGIISFGSPFVVDNSNTSWISAAFDSFSNKIVIAYRDNGNSGYGTAVVYTPSGTVQSTNADSWLGLASQNISDGGTGTITILSGVNENQTGLTPGASYYVNYDGTLTATENAGPLLGTYGKIGRALSSTKLLITEGNA